MILGYSEDLTKRKRVARIILQYYQTKTTPP